LIEAPPGRQNVRKGAPARSLSSSRKSGDFQVPEDTLNRLSGFSLGSAISGWRRFPERYGFGRAEKRCAAQAEYLRLAAQAYSPSDAMSQASICLDGLEKVQRQRSRIRALKREFTTDVSLGEGGWSSRFFPAVSDLAA